MAYSNEFWRGVEKIGSGLGGLAGAYSLAITWGSVTSVGGLFAGAAGIIVGGILGAFVGALVVPFVVWLMSSVVETVVDLVNEVIQGMGMMLGFK